MVLAIVSLLENMSYHILWNFGVLFVVLIMAIVYLFLLPSHEKHTKKQTISFLMGLVLLFIALGSPINIAGRMIFRMHMIQMMILVFLSAPFIVYGFKWAIMDRFLKNASEKILKVFQPKWTITFFHVVFYGYHIPFMFNEIRTDYVMNYLSVFVLLLAAVIAWIPYLHQSEALKQALGKVSSFSYLVFLIPFIPMVLIYAFSNLNLYPVYSDPSLLKSAILLCLPQGVTIDMLSNDLIEILLPYSPIEEQKMAALILFAAVGIFSMKNLVWGILHKIQSRME